jgi:hypothetical protein
LTDGDPSGWNDTDVEDGGASRLFVAVIEDARRAPETARATIRAVVEVSGAAIAAGETVAKQIMVEKGRLLRSGCAVSMPCLQSGSLAPTTGWTKLWNAPFMERCRSQQSGTLSTIVLTK